MLIHSERAQRALRANLTPRYMRLDRLERYVRGTQYEGRPSFWDDSKPLYERAPCVVYPLAQSAIGSTADMVLGEGRWPAITSNPVETPHADGKPSQRLARGKLGRGPFDPRFALSEEESDGVDRLIEAAVHQTRLRAVCGELLESAMATGSAAAVCSVRGGKLRVDVVQAKWCAPTFEDDDRCVEVLEIRYPYLEEYWDEAERGWAVRCLLYRRVIDATSDTTYQPAVAREDGREPEWVVDAAKSTQHGLGFAPVVWYRYRPSCTTVADYDGRAIHADLLDEIDALNFALSQRHAAAMVAASPPTVETGVDEDHSPAPMGTAPRVLLPTPTDMAHGYAGNGAWVDGVQRSGMPARRRGPGVVWRYPSADARVSMLALPGDALTPVDSNARDLRSKLTEAMGVVLLDVDSSTFSADLSGKAIARLYDRQVRLCDKVREDFGDGALLPIVDMLLRVALSVGRSTRGALYLPGLEDALPVLARFEAQVEGREARSWFAPELDLSWGTYFSADGLEQRQIVDLCKIAHEAGLISQRTAVEKLREVFDLGSVDEYLEKLAEEHDEGAHALSEAQAALASAMDKTEDDEDEDDADAEDADEAAASVAARASASTGVDARERAQDAGAAPRRRPFGRGRKPSTR